MSYADAGLCCSFNVVRLHLAANIQRIPAKTLVGQKPAASVRSRRASKPARVKPGEDAALGRYSELHHPEQTGATSCSVSMPTPTAAQRDATGDQAMRCTAVHVIRKGTPPVSDHHAPDLPASRSASLAARAAANTDSSGRYCAIDLPPLQILS
jgi:hypothetical protein